MSHMTLFDSTTTIRAKRTRSYKTAQKLNSNANNQK
jgi:hypothetical protein